MRRLAFEIKTKKPISNHLCWKLNYLVFCHFYCTVIEKILIAFVLPILPWNSDKWNFHFEKIKVELKFNIYNGHIEILYIYKINDKILWINHWDSNLISINVTLGVSVLYRTGNRSALVGNKISPLVTVMVKVTTFHLVFQLFRPRL